MRKYLVLGVLFVLPIVAYLFFASGVNNFARLPVLTKEVLDLNQLRTDQEIPVSFQDKISVVAFFGNDPDDLKGHTFNLDQKILEKFYEFNDFQFVIVLPEEAQPQAVTFAEDFSGISNTRKWKFVYGNEEQIREVFNSFNTNLELDSNLQTPFVFIVDKDRSLRGRSEDDDEELLYGYDSRSVSELGNKMNDDVKVILAEYRLELKKNKSKSHQDL